LKHLARPAPCSTLHPKPTPLNPNPESRIPNPESLIPNPSTLHPEPRNPVTETGEYCNDQRHGFGLFTWPDHKQVPLTYTLHPTPYTLHPTPYSLHPTPCTLHPAPYILHARMHAHIHARTRAHAWAHTVPRRVGEQQTVGRGLFLVARWPRLLRLALVRV